MNLNWLPANTIFLTVHGSQAYGIAHSTSDLDVKGVCVPPVEVVDNLFQGFDQAENHDGVNSHHSVTPRINPLNPKVESVVYSLRKFFKLAADVNPNIIEVLFTDPSDHLIRAPVSDDLLEIRDEFLSSKAKFTFTGYAVAQLAKINRHRKWLVDPILRPPARADFGLPEVRPPAMEAVAREAKRQVEEWNFHQYRLDDLERNELKEHCWELVARLASGREVGWDNWPDEYWKAALDKLQSNLNLSDELTRLISSERQYEKAARAHASYTQWEAGRNPERKALEEKYQYDVKHGAHLARLLRMGVEILETGRVIVKRPDAEELRLIRNGGWTYDQLVEYAAEMEKKINAAYAATKLPRSTDQVKLNKHYHRMVEKWRSRNGAVV